MGGTQAAFTVWDWAVLIAYFVGITAFGLWVARKIRSSGGYFLGDRQLPWWVMAGQAFGTGTHAENPVAQAGVTFHFGFATIWYQWKNMLITPFYWLMAPWYRRCERTTIGEMFEDRYGRGLGMLYTVFALFYFVFNQGTMMKGAGKVIATATGGEMISANQVVLAMAAAFILYSFFGGLVASAYTDFVQGFLIITLSFMLIPSGIWAVGGITGMRDNLTTQRVTEYAAKVEAKRAAELAHAEVHLAELRRAEDAAAVEKQREKVNNLSKPVVIPGDKKGTEQFFDLYNQFSGVDAFWILMFTLNGFIGITAQPHILSMNATGRTERAGRVGQTYGNFVKRFCTIGWGLTGLLAAALVVQHGAALDDREQAFGYASLHLLGQLGFGLTGLMVACILAANMSTCSNFMVNTGALFTKNFYSLYLRPQAADKELLWVGKLSGLSLTALGVLIALCVTQVLQAFMFSETLPAFLGIALMGGILWKRANRYGALAAIALSVATYFALNYLLTCKWQVYDPLSCNWEKRAARGVIEAFAFLHQAWQEGQLGALLGSGELKVVYTWLPGPYGLATLVGVVVFIVVSLLTRPEDPQRIERIFDDMRRSTDEEGLPAGAAKPLAADRGEDLLLLDLPGWLTAERWRGFFRRYREDLVGFVLAWGAVALLVLSAWGLMQVCKLWPAPGA